MLSKLPPGGSNRLPGLVAKQQAVEFPQVLASYYNYSLSFSKRKECNNCCKSPIGFKAITISRSAISVHLWWETMEIMYCQ